MEKINRWNDVEPRCSSSTAVGISFTIAARIVGKSSARVCMSVSVTVSPFYLSNLSVYFFIVVASIVYLSLYICLLLVSRNEYPPLSPLQCVANSSAFVQVGAILCCALLGDHIHQYHGVSEICYALT